MARRHWLDPLARRLLQATGQLPPDPVQPPAACNAAALAPTVMPAAAPDGPDDPAVERELLALKLRLDPNLPLRNATEVRQLAALGWRLDVNRASRHDWQRLPGIRAEQVDLLLRLQASGVQLSGPEDLQRLLELESAQLQGWLPVLAFRWYGEPPAAAALEVRLDLNRATLAQLADLGLSPQRAQRLLRERARQPFRDLADLQQRLQLPPDLVEHWIGRVRFGRGLSGPVLPPPRRR